MRVCVCVCVCACMCYRRFPTSSSYLGEIIQVAHPLGRGVAITITDRDEWQEVLHIIHKSYMHIHKTSVGLHVKLLVLLYLPQSTHACVVDHPSVPAWSKLTQQKGRASHL